MVVFGGGEGGGLRSSVREGDDGDGRASASASASAN